MPNKLDLVLLCLLPDKINRFYQIIGQIKNCEVPIVSPVWIIEIVAPTIFIASGISKPDVIALIDQLYDGRAFFPNDPAVGGSEKAVLKECDRCIWLSMVSFDPKKRLAMPIGRFCCVALVFHALFFNHLLEVFVIIGIFASLFNIGSGVDLVEKWRLSRILLTAI